MSHAMEEPVGQFDCVQRSLIFIYGGQEQGPNSFIYRSSAPRASRDQSDLFMAKDEAGLIVADWPKGEIRPYEIVAC